MPPRNPDLHRVLSSATRVGILELLRSSPRPLDATQIARQLGRHPSTIREHLTLLEDGGLISRTEAEDAGHRPRGRPRILYTVCSERDQDPTVCAGNRFLARALAAFVEGTAGNPTQAAEQTGAAWARHLIDPEPFTQTTAREAVERIVEMCRDIGLDPEVDRHEDGLEIRLRRCPFRDVKDAHAVIACGVHRGLLQGALRELGAPLALEGFEPRGDDGSCVAVLRPSLRSSPTTT